MAKRHCPKCREHVKEWNLRCKDCGFTLILEPKEEARKRYLRGPSLGALFFTQGWAFGARLYLLFVLSFIPIIGFLVLFAGFFFGRRLSWTQGGWGSWQEFQARMKILDLIGVAWVVFLLLLYFFIKQ